MVVDGVNFDAGRLLLMGEEAFVESHMPILWKGMEADAREARLREVYALVCGKKARKRRRAEEPEGGSPGTPAAGGDDPADA